MSSNTANMVIFVLMVLLPLAAVLALEVFLSRRPSWWPGLVLPCSVTLGAEWDFSCENSAIREGDIVACGERHFLRGDSLVSERHDPRNA